ncbi:MAG: Replication factor A [Methanomassiliicoccales archaeon PtaU1.Bin124]|nr:MAG: Replication factor A [Methanomassiliicoccales archaeon PtaU1.Bin124]
MEKDEIAPHVKEIARVLNGKVEESKIEEELENYLNVYRVSLDTAKRSVVKNFGGDPNALTRGNRRKVSDVKGGEQNVDLLVRVLTLNPKEVEIKGEKRQLAYGLVADETGSMGYTLWEPQRLLFKPGDVIMLRNAYSKEYNGRVDLNLGNRANVEQMPKDALPQIDAPAGGSYAPGETVKVGELADGMNNVTVSGRIVTVERREINTEDGAKVVFSGILADETGKVQYSAWADYQLKEGELVRISRAYVKGWKGVPKLNFGERAGVVRLKAEDLPEVTSGKPKPRSIEDIERVGGATDALVIGTIVDVKEGSGLIKRCPQCKRVVLKGACRIHGKVEGIWDLRVKAILDDGNSTLAVVMNRTVTETVLGQKLEDCVKRAQEALNPDVVREMVEEKILAKPMQVRGNVLSDEYGLMMIVSEASAVETDLKEAAVAMLAELEGFQ